MSDQNAARAQYGCKDPSDAASAQYKECQGRPLGQEAGRLHEHPHTGFMVAPMFLGGLLILVAGLTLRKRAR